MSADHSREDLDELLKQSEAVITSDLGRYREITDEGFRVAEAIESYDHIAHFLLRRAWVKRVTHDHEGSHEDLGMLDKLLHAHPEVRTPLLTIRLNYQYAQQYRRDQKYQESRQKYLEALTVANETNDAYWKGSIYLELGLLLTQGFSDVQGSIEYYRNALKYITKGSTEHSVTLFNIASIATASGDFVTARAYLDELHSAGPIGKRRESLLYTLSCLVVKEEGSLNEALTWAEKAVESAVGLPYESMVEALFARSGILYYQGNFLQAINDLQAAYEQLPDSDDNSCLSQVFLARAFSAIRSERSTDTAAHAKAREYVEKAEKQKDVLADYSKLTFLETMVEVKSNLNDKEGAYDDLTELRILEKKLFTAKVKNEIGAQRLLMKIERDEYERGLEKLKRGQIEKELARTTVHLAMQTEMVANFRNELRLIVREMTEPIDALKKIKEKLKTLPCEQIDWLKFEKEFTSVHPEFKSKLEERYPDLTKQEVKMCQLARLGLKNIEVAQLLCLSERSVEGHRLNLRKKIGLRTNESLGEFLATIQ